MPLLKFVGQYAKLDQTSLSSVEAVNYYTEFYPVTGTKTDVAIQRTPGAIDWVEVSSLDTETGRGLYISSKGPAPDFAPRQYGVWGTKVYRMSRDNTKAWLLGEVSSNTPVAGMADNGFEFVIVDGTAMYSCPLDHVDGLGALTQVTLPNVPDSTISIQPTHVAFLKQRLWINGGNTDYFWYSELASTEFIQDSVYKAESSADNILSLVENNNTLWIHGFRSFEQWRGSDNQDDPLDPVGGSQSQLGVKGRYTTATSNNMVFWLGASDTGSDAIFMGSNATVTRISDPAIEETIDKIGNTELAIGYAYSTRGNTFYVITFESAGLTLVYNTTTKLWHRASKRNLPNGKWQAWPYAFARQVGDSVYAQLLFGGSRLVKLDNDHPYEWDGEAIVRKYVTQPLWDNYDNMILTQVTLDMETGATDILDPAIFGSDPQMTVEVSFDGGHSYGNLKPTPLGKQGRYRTKVSWHTKGKGRSIVLRFRCSAPVKHAIYGGRVDYTKCSRT